jgi:hypothetical protein
MFCWLRGVILGISVFVLSFAAYAQEVSREQIKGLDEQVQEIKSDVLSIAAELNQLEEKLLYPSNTQIAVFVSLAEGETFRLDSVEIQLDDKAVAHHLYTFKELEALQKPSGGTGFRNTNKFKVNKDVGPRIVEISLTSQNITMKDM